MRLPNGITGICVNSSTVFPKVEGKLLKRICYSSVFSVDGQIIHFSKPKYPVNFYSVKVKILEDTFYLLLNDNYPFIAFVSKINELYGITFIDDPMLTQKLAPYYQVLGTELLYTTLNLEILEMSALNPLEKQAIDYWKPKTIGDIIFNFWD